MKPSMKIGLIVFGVLVGLALLFYLFFVVAGLFGVGIGSGVGNYSYDLPGGYWLVSSSRYDIKVLPKDTFDHPSYPRIPAMVAEIAFDDRYIVAKRYGLQLDPEHPSSGYQIPDEGSVDYYILDTETHTMYMFSSNVEFNEKRKALKIPSTLELKDVASYYRPSQEK